MNKPFCLTQQGIWQLRHAFILIIISFFTFQVYGQSQNDTSVESVTPIKRAEPKYPQYAVNRKIEGAVLVIYSIEKDGAVSDIEVVKSDQEGLFDASVILAVQKWMFKKPAQKLRNNYVAIEFAVTDDPATTKFGNVEKIQVRAK